MKLALVVLTALASTAIPRTAYADVNMLEASFRKTFIDAETYGLKLQRRYDSRLNFNGVFGFGWCSTFDIKLKFGKSLELDECGKLRTPETVRYVNGTYAQTLPNGLVRTFSSETGELTSLKAPGNRALEIERTRLPRDAALGEGLKTRQTEGNGNRPAGLTLLFDSLGENVVALAVPTNPATPTNSATPANTATPQTNTSPPASTKLLLFTYSADRDLLEATNAWSNTYRFEYDQLHNLTTINYPDHTQELLEYDTDNDQLTRFQGRDRCIETYDHVISKAANDIHQISAAHLACPEDGRRNRPASGTRFDFGFKRTNGKWTLTTFKRSST